MFYSERCFWVGVLLLQISSEFKFNSFLFVFSLSPLIITCSGWERKKFKLHPCWYSCATISYGTIIILLVHLNRLTMLLRLFCFQFYRDNLQAYERRMCWVDFVDNIRVPVHCTVHTAQCTFYNLQLQKARTSFHMIYVYDPLLHASKWTNKQTIKQTSKRSLDRAYAVRNTSPHITHRHLSLKKQRGCPFLVILLSINNWYFVLHALTLKRIAHTVPFSSKSNVMSEHEQWAYIKCKWTAWYSKQKTHMIGFLFHTLGDGGGGGGSMINTSKKPSKRKKTTTTTTRTLTHNMRTPNKNIFRIFHTLSAITLCVPKPRQ